MNKESVFQLFDLLSPTIQKQDTSFCHAIPANNEGCCDLVQALLRGITSNSL